MITGGRHLNATFYERNIEMSSKNGKHRLCGPQFFNSSTDYSTTCNVIRTFDKQEQFCQHLGKSDYSTLFLAENFNFLCQAMASSGSAAHIANVSGDTSSESATSARSAPAERRSFTRTRRHWTTATVEHRR
jgi:hypothetical protein